jgi:hypothetical protein
MSNPMATGLRIFAFSRTGGFDRQFSISAEAECSIHYRQLVTPVKLKVLEKDAAVF